MPAYNASRYIAEAIDSILNQTLTDFELLICDDGSKDNTLSIIKSYAAKDNRIAFFENNKNVGNLKTTNFLFEKCTGKYIALQDADDYSEPERLEVLFNLFLNNCNLGIAGSYYKIIDSKNQHMYSGMLPLDNKVIKEEMKKEVIPILYPSIMVKKEVAAKAGLFQLFFDRKGYADFDWMARCAEVSEAENSNRLLYSYRKHDDSFTHKEKNNKDLILQNMHILMVQAHVLRGKGEKDFFELNNTKAIKTFICNTYIRRAENCFWEKKSINAYANLYVALRANFFNLRIYKTFFFIFRNSFF